MPSLIAEKIFTILSDVEPLRYHSNRKGSHWLPFLFESFLIAFFQQHAAFHMMGIGELIEQRQACDPMSFVQRF